MQGNNSFAQTFAAKGLDVDFDIVLTNSHPHWRVTLQKVSATTASRAFVDWDARTIQFFSQDNSPKTVTQDGRGAQTASGFVTTPHEFGHTLLADDEYTVGAPSRADLQSIMNIGGQVRPRHFKFITHQLNMMQPGCVFTAA